MFVNPTACAGLTDVTLTDEDTNSLLTDNAHRTIPGKVAMQLELILVLVAKFAINKGGVTC